MLSPVLLRPCPHLMECVGKLCRFLSLSELSIACQLSHAVHKEMNFKFQGLTPLFKNVLHLPATCLCKMFCFVDYKSNLLPQSGKAIFSLVKIKGCPLVARWSRGCACLNSKLYAFFHATLTHCLNQKKKRSQCSMARNSDNCYSFF